MDRGTARVSKDLVNLTYTWACFKSTTLPYMLQVKHLPPGSGPNCLWTHKHGCYPKYCTHYWRYRKVRPDCESQPLSTAVQFTAQQRNVSKQLNLCLQMSPDTPLCIRAFFLSVRYMPFSTHKLTSTNTAPVTQHCSRQPAKLSKRMVWGSTQDSRHAPYPLSLGLQEVSRSWAGLGDQLLPTGKAWRQMTFNPTSLIVPISQKSPYKAN